MALLSLLALLVAAAPDVYPHNCTYKQGGTGSVTRACADKLADALAAKEFGAKCDGVTDDAPALALANTAAVAQGKAIFIGCKLRIASAAGTVAAGLRFEGAGALDLSPLGGSVTLTGPLTAPMGQVFYTGSGTLTFSAKVAQVVPEWWGAVGDGVTDDTAASQAAITGAQSAGAALRFPKGTFKIATGLTPTNIDVLGEGPDNTVINFSGTGAAITFIGSNGVTLAGLKLVSQAAGQTGVLLEGSWNRVDQMRIEGFDTHGLQLGVSGSVGAFYNHVSNLFIYNQLTQGQAGVYVSGIPVPSSNANHFVNVVVNGRWTRLYEIYGTKNIFDNGDSIPDTQGTGVGAIWYIDGIQNEIHGSYSELAAGGAIPTTIATFTANSFSNKIVDVYLSYVPKNQSTAFSDAGWGNKVETRAVGVNFLTVGSNRGLANLVANSGFQQWDTAQPYGWVTFSGTAAQDVVTTHGTATSLKITGAGTNVNVQHYFASASAGNKSLNQLPVAYFQGKQITCSVWCKSSFAGIGNLRIGSNGTGGGDFGAASHSGGGAWELLTASALIAPDATNVELSLRASNGGGNLTGDIWFSEPICAVGTEVPHYAARSLNDTQAQLMGPLVGAPPQVIAYSSSMGSDWSLGNSFVVTATNGTAMTFNAPANPKKGQCETYTVKNGSGGVLGAITWNAVFKTGGFTAAPANLKNRSIQFCYDGTNAIETFQSAADVPN